MGAGRRRGALRSGSPSLAGPGKDPEGSERGTEPGRRDAAGASHASPAIASLALGGGGRLPPLPFTRTEGRAAPPS